MKRRFIVIGIVFILIGIALYFLPESQLPFISPVTTKTLVSLLPSPRIPPKLTKDSIFASDHSWTQTIPADKKWTLVATGDIIPARSVNFQTVTRKDFTWSWKNIIPILKNGDITLINLESPLIPNCQVTNVGMTFCADPRHIEGMIAAQVDVANFANNHMGNYGEKGIKDTQTLLESGGIKATGLNTVTTMKVKGFTLSFLGYDDIGPNVPPIAKADEELMKKQIIEAKNLSDIVIVSMNWGVEYTDKPSDRQVQLAHLAIDSGADLIIGNHPHWIQPVELYKGKVIMYAHGNTIFDQMWSEKTKIGVIGIYTFYGKDLVDIEFIPTYIKDYGQPEVLTGEKKGNIVQSLEQISYGIPE